MHTPGPWVIFHADKDGANDVLPAGRPGCIARDIIKTEDAFLIAAAPNLLAAGKLVLESAQSISAEQTAALSAMKFAVGKATQKP